MRPDRDLFGDGRAQLFRPHVHGQASTRGSEHRDFMDVLIDLFCARLRAHVSPLLAAWKSAVWWLHLYSTLGSVRHSDDVQG